MSTQPCQPPCPLRPAGAPAVWRARQTCAALTRRTSPRWTMLLWRTVRSSTWYWICKQERMPNNTKTENFLQVWWLYPQRHPSLSGQYWTWWESLQVWYLINSSTSSFPEVTVTLHSLFDNSYKQVCDGNKAGMSYQMREIINKCNEFTIFHIEVTLPENVWDIKSTRTRIKHNKGNLNFTFPIHTFIHKTTKICFLDLCRYFVSFTSDFVKKNGWFGRFIWGAEN